MKKIFSVMLLLLVVLFVVVSCGPVSVDEKSEASIGANADVNADAEVGANTVTTITADGVMTTVKTEATVGENKIVVDTDNVDINTTVTATGTSSEVVVDKSTVTTKGTMTAAELEAFCVKGRVYNYASEQGTVDVVYEGMVDFKGGRFCKGLHTQTIQGMTINSVYYMTANGEDIWVETEVAGQKSEVHITQK